MTPTIPTVILQGTAFERGRQHGARFRAEIVGAITAARAEHGAAVYGAARAQAAVFWPSIEAQAKAVADEINGIAAGAESDPIDVLLRSGFELFGLPAVSGCSAIAARGPNGALVAQNWDAPLSFGPELVLFLHFGPEGFEQAIIAATGGLCWVGCNRHGLAFVNNDLMLSSHAVGMPSQIVRRLILAEQSVAGAIAQLQAIRHMGGRSYLLGDASGAVAGVEVSARFGVRVNPTGPILHTNHALDPEIRADETDAKLMGIYPSSRHRYEMLKRKHPAVPSVPSLAALLADRDGYPDAISKGSSNGEPSATLFSVIFDCAERALHLCAGEPANGVYRRVAW
jgi:predicted choloylglycine hydrolase